MAMACFGRGSRRAHSAAAAINQQPAPEAFLGRVFATLHTYTDGGGGHCKYERVVAAEWTGLEW